MHFQSSSRNFFSSPRSTKILHCSKSMRQLHVTEQSPSAKLSIVSSPSRLRGVPGASNSAAHRSRHLKERKKLTRRQESVTEDAVHRPGHREVNNFPLSRINVILDSVI